jgi:putative transposase
MTGTGLSFQQAAEALHIPRATLYRWGRRLKTEEARGLEDRSRRPKHGPGPQWSQELSEAVQPYREQSGWDKEKLPVLLKQEGWQTSASAGGRILQRLKARDVLREPLRHGIRAYKRCVKRPYATRKPKECTMRELGDLVQVDTLDVRPLPNVVIKQISARDMVSRWDVIEALRSMTGRHSRKFWRR